MSSDLLLQKYNQVFQTKYFPLQIHSEGITSFLIHPDEAYLSIAFRLGFLSKTKIPLDSKEYIFCETILKKVSRSFALVIQTLPDDLRISVCVFYLVLRALDTIEDDMVSFQSNTKKKEEALLSFASLLQKKTWTFEAVGVDDEKRLLEEFQNVLDIYHSLSLKDKKIIKTTCAKMAKGMVIFLRKHIRLGTESLAEYNLYSHFVAGLVGQGLTELFVAHGYEKPSLLNSMKEANEMGLFLQKVNILRDYLEDLQEGRTFWPKEIWQKYAGSLLALRTSDQEKSLQCLNELIVDAYRHLPACIQYLEKIENPKIFTFCAIPQVMAIATLERLVNNPDVFTGIIKIRKGLMLSLFQHTSTMEEVKGILSTYSDAILSNIPKHHKAYKDILPISFQVQSLCSDGVQPNKPWPSFVSLLLSMSVLIYAYFQNTQRNWIDLLLLFVMSIFLFFKKSFGVSSNTSSKGSA